MTTTEPNIDQAFAIAHQLGPADKLRLIERLVRDVLPSVQPSSTQHTPTHVDTDLNSESVKKATTPTHQKLWAQLQDTMRDLPTPRPTLATQLDRDRQDRDRNLSEG